MRSFAPFPSATKARIQQHRPHLVGFRCTLWIRRRFPSPHPAPSQILWTTQLPPLSFWLRIHPPYPWFPQGKGESKNEEWRMRNEEWILVMIKTSDFTDGHRFCLWEIWWLRQFYWKWWCHFATGIWDKGDIEVCFSCCDLGDSQNRICGLTEALLWI